MSFRLLAMLFFATLMACVTAEDAKKSDALRELGLAYLHEGNTPDAFRMLLKAEEYNPRSPEVLHELGLAYFSVERYAEAESYMTEAIRRDPELSEARLNLGSLYLATGRFEESVVLFEQVATDPLYHRPYRAFNNLGLAYLELGRSDEAIKAYRQSLKLAPGFCQVYYNLGVLYRDDGEFVESDALFMEAAARCPRDGRFQLEKAAILVRDGKYYEARPILEAISQGDPRGELGERANSLLQVIQ